LVERCESCKKWRAGGKPCNVVWPACFSVGEVKDSQQKEKRYSEKKFQKKRWKTAPPRHKDHTDHTSMEGHRGIHTVTKGGNHNKASEVQKEKRKRNARKILEGECQPSGRSIPSKVNTGIRFPNFEKQVTPRRLR